MGKNKKKGNIKLHNGIVILLYRVPKSLEFYKYLLNGLTDFLIISVSITDYHKEFNKSQQ